ncbi:hypothetical protein ZIOFF_012186 [Zingiber officinale]|uniref:AAA+ ATPase domain-containing protein n=1 Tax=Zingiber officinale TaxID=94328 RepID=A0A8J5M2Y7_ZINOF|nr:hypothetical protein ZIOFF_012186 [Zingiber officinale]
MAFIKLNFNVDVHKCLSGLKATLGLGRPKSSIDKLEREMERLRAKRDDIRNQIVDAERDGKLPTNEVNRWLDEVEELEGKVTSINQDFRSMSCFSCNCFNQTGGTTNQTRQVGDQVPIRESSNCYSINRRAAEKLNEANELMSRTNALDPIAITTIPSRIGSDIQETMARLRAKRDDIKNQINQAEREGKIPTNEVGQWLLEVEKLDGQVATINQIPIRESPWKYSIIQRVAKKHNEVNELMIRADVLDPIVTVGPPKPIVTLPILYRSHVGIGSYVEEIVGYIDGGKDNIIGIHGMGGVGKTTVLKSIQHHYLLKHTIFDPVIWVVASKDCQLKRLQMDIAKSLGLKTLQESDDEQTCSDKLFSYLKNKKCLLFLDDIWEHLDLQLLGMAHSATDQGQQQQQRKVVVFTTRNQIVCAQMEAEKKIKIECLNPAQAWQLFVKNFKSDAPFSDAGIHFVAQELVKECAGLPLALITVARAMLGKKSRDVWNHALHQIRNKHQWTTIGLSEDSNVMYKAFKLSYDSLEDDSTRECLLCCALWPEDHDIHIFEELIPCWIGCGIIHYDNVFKRYSISDAFQEGCWHLEALINASLLEHSSRRPDYYEAQHVKMHDVIRDMTLLTLKENKRKWIVKAGIGLRHLPRQEEWQEAERASFMDNEITSLQDYGASTFPKLSMLNLHSNHLSEIHPMLFTNMPLLTYLNLSLNLGIEELPKEIGCLTELQYLNLSETSITNLPAEFGRLGKLKYLLLRDTKLETVPNGTISNLSTLRWLDIREIYPSHEWWWDELEHFRGRSKYLSLGITINPDKLKRLETLPNNVSVWSLTVRGLGSSKLPEYNLGTLQWNNKVRYLVESLEISDVPGHELTMPGDWNRILEFYCLKTLCFRTLEQLENIRFNPVEYEFNNLRDLYICGCNKLKDVSCVLDLRYLNLLDIKNCEEIEELISNVGNSNSISRIRMLSLNGMRNLHRFAHQPFQFPALEYIRVLYCPRLKKLPFEAKMLKKIEGEEEWWNNWNWDEESNDFSTPCFRLKEIEGEKDWWNNLDWDDESIKDSLTPYFRNVDVYTTPSSYNQTSFQD